MTTSLIEDAQQLIVQEIRTKIDAAIWFSLSLNNLTTYDAIQNFQIFIDIAIASEQNICVSCELFIAASFRYVVN